MPDWKLHNLPVPRPYNPLPPAGAHLVSYLEQVAQLALPVERQMALRYLFRWFLSLEGREEQRLSPAELNWWRGRFYSVLPESLKADFPWEVPAPLPPPSYERPPYPRYHTPFRQYGFIAARVVDTLQMQSSPPLLAAFVRGLMQILQQHGERVDTLALAKHIEDLSGGRLRVSEEVFSLVGRVGEEGGSGTAASEGPRRVVSSGRGRRFHRGRRR